MNRMAQLNSPPFRSHSAAVDRQAVSGHVPGARPTSGRRGVGDLPRGTEPLQRYPVARHLLQGRVRQQARERAFGAAPDRARWH